MEAVPIAVVSSLLAGALGWFGANAWRAWREAADRRVVFEWLESTTCDAIGNSHADIVAIAKGTRLSEDRVRCACMTDERILRHAGDPELWSIWRQDPQKRQGRVMRLR